MDLKALNAEIKKFSKEKHGSSDYDKDVCFVAGDSDSSYAPLSYLIKKSESCTSDKDLYQNGYVCDSLDLIEDKVYPTWFEFQFSKKLKRTQSKKISIIYLPDNNKILAAIDKVNQGYEVLRNNKILLNGKKLPVQLGEWFIKTIFGLGQRKSTSQRGFDFFFEGKRVEVKVHWGDHSSPKGVKLRKSLVVLSDYCIVVYIGNNFMIREICFLDSEFILRKFNGKGHIIFVKDTDVKSYFFSRSDKHYAKVANKTALMKYASPVLAMKLSESF